MVNIVQVFPTTFIILSSCHQLDRTTTELAQTVMLIVFGVCILGYKLSWESAFTMRLKYENR